MKNASRVALSLCFGLAASPVLAASVNAPVLNAPSDVKAITAIETFGATSLDMNAVVANYAPNALVYDLMVPGVYHGRTQIIAGYGPQLKALKTITGTLPDINIISDGTMACAAVQMHLNLTPKMGAPIALSLRQLDILRKVNGRWFIEFEHVSFPADPKTGMAVMDYSVTPATPFIWQGNPFPGPEIPSAVAKREIRAWTEQFATALTVADFEKTMGPGDDVLIYDTFALTPLRGRKMIADFYTPGFAPLVSTEVAFTQFYADTDGYIGAQQDTQNLVIKMTDGSPLRWTVRQSDCLHYVDGKWYTMFDALSFPTDMKTGKAVMNTPQ